MILWCFSTSSAKNYRRARQWRTLALFLIHHSTVNQKRSVLIVEDDAPLRSLLSELLARDDRNIHTAATLREAYQVLSGQPVELILLDLYLPDGSGFSLLNDIHGRNPELSQFPVAIIITAFGNWESHIKAYNLGAHYFLDKPFKITQVKALVERALHPENAAENTHPAVARNLK